MQNNTALIVEDQVITALDLKYILKRCGYTKQVIMSKGKKAIEFLEREEPSVALLDIKLADGVSGIDIAKKLEKKGIPFIFISAFSDPNNLRRAKELNHFGIIKKPINENYLKQVLHKLNHN